MQPVLGSGWDTATTVVALGAARRAGVDVVDVERLGTAVRRIGPALERRICTPAERADLSTDPGTRLLDLAMVFGVKESVLKALGGMAPGGRFADIDARGVPGRAGTEVVLGGASGARAAALDLHLVTGHVPAPAGTVLVWAAARSGSPRVVS